MAHPKARCQACGSTRIRRRASHNTASGHVWVCQDCNAVHYQNPVPDEPEDNDPLLDMRLEDLI